jgi:hypothetical protein
MADNKWLDAALMIGAAIIGYFILGPLIPLPF